MTIKSLTITEEAYNALKRLRQGDESFSKIIVRISNEKGSISEYFGALKDSKELSGIKKRIKERRAKINSEFSERAKKMRKNF